MPRPRIQAGAAFADLLNGDGVQVEGDAVGDVDPGQVPDDLDEVVCGDVGADGVRVGILRRAAGTVCGEQDAALEDKVSGVRRPRQPIEKGLQEVADQVFLGRCADAGSCGGGSCRRLDPAVALVAGGHVSSSRACRMGPFVRGRWDAVSMRAAGLPPRRSHSFRASRGIS